MDIYARIAHLALIPPIMDLKDPAFISMGCLLGQSPWPVNRSTSLGEGRGGNSRSPLSSVPVTQLVRQPPFTTEACSQNPSLGPEVESRGAGGGGGSGSPGGLGRSGKGLSPCWEAAGEAALRGRACGCPGERVGARRLHTAG